MISFLESDDGEIRGQKEIIEHIVSFYKILFGHSDVCSIRLQDDFWPDKMRLNENGNYNLSNLLGKRRLRVSLWI